jgi:hypothetical protein
MLWLVILSLFIISLAALPPLTEEELNSEARYIVVGKVKTVSSGEVRGDQGSNYQYKAIVEVVRVEKGLLMSIDPTEVVSQPPGAPTPGDQIEVHYWQAGDRPLGWSGPAGQYSGLREDTMVRLYLSQESEGRLHLLEPNGWESINV